MVIRPRCKGSTLSRHVRGLVFDSRGRTLFSIDLCCIYLVFTMLFIFVKRMYSYAWCSVHVVKVARFPGTSEVSGSIPVSGLCFLLIFVVFTLCLPCYSSLLRACTVKRGAPSTACALLIPNLNRTSPDSITHLIIQYCSPVCTYSRRLHEKT